MLRLFPFLCLEIESHNNVIKPNIPTNLFIYLEIGSKLKATIEVQC